MWRRHHFLSGLAIYVVAGCAAVPEPVEYDGIRVEHIVDAVQCELASVFLEGHPYRKSMRDWVANVVLALKVVNEAETNPTVTIKPPISGGTLALAVGPSLSDQTNRTAQISFDVHMRDLDPEIRKRTPNSMPVCGNRSTGLPYAETGLGLREWVLTIATAAGRPDFASLGGAVYNLQFVVKRGVHGGFTFERSHVTVDATGTTASKTNDNQMVVTFAEDPAPTVSRGKTKTSPEAKERIYMQRERFLPQRLILQSGSGRLTQ